MGGDRLKQALSSLGLKCGGTVAQRAARLFLTKTTSLSDMDKSLFAPAKVCISASVSPSTITNRSLSMTKKLSLRMLSLIACHRLFIHRRRLMNCSQKRN